MDRPLIISGALSNVSGVTNEEFLRFLSKNLPEAQFYQLTGVSKAALDWRIILHDVGAAASIAALLWTAYTSLIEPTKPGPKSDAGIYIVIGDEESQRFWIGKDYKKKEVFIDTFTKEVKQITETKSGKQKIKREIKETKETRFWIRIKE